jgi:hypothetical protein
MPTFRVIEKATGIAVYEYTNETALDLVGFEFATHDHVEVVEEAAPPDPRKYGGRRRVSKLEFIDLLTDTEYVTILAAAKESVQIEAWIRKMELATPEDDGTSIDLDDPRTQGGVQALELIGLIGEGRAEEILNG